MGGICSSDSTATKYAPLSGPVSDSSGVNGAAIGVGASPGVSAAPSSASTGGAGGASSGPTTGATGRTTTNGDTARTNGVQHNKDTKEGKRPTDPVIVGVGVGGVDHVGVDRGVGVGSGGVISPLLVPAVTVDESDWTRPTGLDETQSAAIIRSAIQSSMFATCLTSFECERLISFSELRGCRVGSRIFSQLSPAGSIYLIESGEIHLEVVTDAARNPDAPLSAIQPSPPSATSSSSPYSDEYGFDDHECYPLTPGEYFHSSSPNLGTFLSPGHGRLTLAETQASTLAAEAAEEARRAKEAKEAHMAKREAEKRAKEKERSERLKQSSDMQFRGLAGALLSQMTAGLPGIISLPAKSKSTPIKSSQSAAAAATPQPPPVTPSHNQSIPNSPSLDMLNSYQNGVPSRAASPIPTIHAANGNSTAPSAISNRGAYHPTHRRGDSNDAAIGQTRPSTAARGHANGMSIVVPSSSIPSVLGPPPTNGGGSNGGLPPVSPSGATALSLPGGAGHLVKQDVNRADPRLRTNSSSPLSPASEPQHTHDIDSIPALPVGTMPPPANGLTTPPATDETARSGFGSEASMLSSAQPTTTTNVAATTTEKVLRVRPSRRRTNDSRDFGMYPFGGSGLPSRPTSPSPSGPANRRRSGSVSQGGFMSMTSGMTSIGGGGPTLHRYTSNEGIDLPVPDDLGSNGGNGEIAPGIVRVQVLTKGQLIGLCGLQSPQEVYLTTAVVHSPGTRLICIPREKLLSNLMNGPAGPRLKDQLGTKLIQALDAAPWLRSLPPSALIALASLFQYASVPSGTSLFHVGDCTSDHSVIYFILEGEVSVEVPEDRGKILKKTLGSGSWIGELSVIVGLCRTGDAKALTPLNVQFITRRSLFRFFNSYGLLPLLTSGARGVLSIYPTLRDEQLLEQMTLQSAFARFCLKEFSLENIEYWQTAVRLRKVILTPAGASAYSRAQVLTEAALLYTRYISERSLVQINLKETVRAQVRTALKSGVLHSDSFKPAEEEILHLMIHDNYARFKASKGYVAAKEELEAPQPYPFPPRNFALGEEVKLGDSQMTPLQIQVEQEDAELNQPPPLPQLPWEVEQLNRCARVSIAASLAWNPSTNKTEEELLFGSDGYVSELSSTGKVISPAQRHRMRVEKAAMAKAAQQAAGTLNGQTGANANAQGGGGSPNPDGHLWSSSGPGSLVGSPISSPPSSVLSSPVVPTRSIRPASISNSNVEVAPLLIVTQNVEEDRNNQTEIQSPSTHNNGDAARTSTLPTNGAATNLGSPSAQHTLSPNDAFDRDRQRDGANSSRRMSGRPGEDDSRSPSPSPARLAVTGSHRHALSRGSASTPHTAATLSLTAAVASSSVNPFASASAYAFASVPMFKSNHRSKRPIVKEGSKLKASPFAVPLSANAKSRSRRESTNH